ncbi:hypothetical protein BS47DRAFT_348040 [Hydnum rufescens UP504]|uniref:Zn(2)-C6 fungal-type domain-containing protein n=1 Tax=Hydnum rufescens UP504 TaxID=1448309 RepID=A0A9P6DLP2_9AGAM|nr:hypothetical protein BS47DRAFT_348040 [Hydnum rufescens UP504]
MIEGALSPGSACLPCRARKTKCDGKQPVCGRCKRLAKSCFFERDPPRPLTQRLQDRILTLEEEIAAIQHQAEPITFPDTFLRHQLFSRRIPHSNAPSLLPIFPLSSLKSGPSGIRFPDHAESHPLEAYGSVIPRSVVEKLLREWDPAQEMPPILSDYLVRLFLPHRIQFYFRVDVSSLLKDIHRPQSDSRCIHPALLNAMYLVACSIAGGDMSSYEAVFLPRVRKHMQQCLAFADRLLHFMWASILLGLFYTRAGRTLEAYSTISATVRFAIGCGVDSKGEREHVSAILPPVMDKMDSRERASIWGAIYLLDRTLCCIANLPSSLPPAAVEHVHRLAFGQEWIVSLELSLPPISSCHGHALYLAL